MGISYFHHVNSFGLFFNRIKDYFENILLITHNPLIREWADNILTIKKDNNISRII